MTAIIAFKASLIWLVMVAFAMANGVFREQVLTPNIGLSGALPLSGVSLSILVFLAAYFSVPFFGKNKGATFLYIGLQWLLMTLLFEFIFGHYVTGKSWYTLLQVFNPMKGDLFVVVLLVSLLSPYLTAKMRGLS